MRNYKSRRLARVCSYLNWPVCDNKKHREVIPGNVLPVQTLEQLKQWIWLQKLWFHYLSRAPTCNNEKVMVRLKSVASYWLFPKLIHPSNCLSQINKILGPLWVCNTIRNNWIYSLTITNKNHSEKFQGLVNFYEFRLVHQPNMTIIQERCKLWKSIAGSAQRNTPAWCYHLVHPLKLLFTTITDVASQ